MSLIDSEAERLLKSRLESGDELVPKPSGAPGLSRRFGSLNKASAKVDSFRKNRLPLVEPKLENSEIKSAEPLPSIVENQNINASAHPIVDRTTGSINNLRYDSQGPIVDHTIGPKDLKDPIVDHTTGRISDLRYKTPEPIVDHTTGSKKESEPLVDYTTGSAAYFEDKNIKSTELISHDTEISNLTASSFNNFAKATTLATPAKEIPTDSLIEKNELSLDQSLKTETSSDSYLRYNIQQGITTRPIVHHTIGSEKESDPLVDHTTGRISDLGYKMPEPMVDHTTGVESKSVEHFRGTFSEVTSSLKSEDLIKISEDDFFSDEFLASKKEEFKVRPQKGHFMIPHELFQGINNTFRSIAERDVFSCLIRESLGWHRDWCQASLSYIAQWTKNNSTANVSKTIKSLETKGFVKVLVPPSAKENRGTVFHIPLATKYLIKLGKPIEPYAGPGSELVGSNNKAEGSLPDFSQEAPKTKPPGAKLENKIADQISTSEYFQIYLKDLPAGQRESEREYLERLLIEDQLMVIEYAVKDLLKNGIGPQKSKCLNPLNYLFKSGSEMLKRARRIVRLPAQPAQAEDISATHPSRMIFEMWRKQLSTDQTWEIIWPLWKEAAAGDEQTVRDWISGHPENLEKQLMSHFIQIMKM